MMQLCALYAARLTTVQLPDEAPDCNPIEYLWKQGTKLATHRTYFPGFTLLQAAVEKALLHCAQTPQEMMPLMTRYCDALGTLASSWHMKLFLKSCRIYTLLDHICYLVGRYDSCAGDAMAR
jgi:hypothetical protein